MIYEPLVRHFAYIFLAILHVIPTIRKETGWYMQARYRLAKETAQLGKCVDILASISLFCIQIHLNKELALLRQNKKATDPAFMATPLDSRNKLLETNC